MKQWYWKLAVAFMMMLSVTVIAASIVKQKRTLDIGQVIESTVESKPVVSQYITVLTDHGEQIMLMEEYLTGVLLCEIPGDFHPEAKKAQAIVARTYGLRVAKLGIKHGVGVVCGDPACCQGFTSAEDYFEKWNDRDTIDTARRAVQETEGIVITYQGDLIDATYFSCSGGMTEDALAVWGAEIPYLQSVTSPGEEESVHYLQTLQFTPQKFCLKLGILPTGDPTDWIGSVKYTKGGGVETIIIGGKEFRGTQLRTMLGLRSTDFTVSANSSSISITTLGFGHRVGMSQYGADAMASNGSTFEEILHHYYQDVQIEKLTEE